MDTYAVVHNSEEIRMNSRSGGVFTALSDYILDRGGVVYGCIQAEDFTASHIRTDNKEERDLMRGSKYVQSELGDALKMFADDMKAGKEILFSGTSCQIDAAKRIAGKYDKVLYVDIVCYGVPSPQLVKKYILWQEQKKGGKVTNFEYRNKREFGWNSHWETLTFDDGKRVSSKIYTECFNSNLAIRPACYECPYKKIMHPGDITIADYWGIEKNAPEMDDNKGVSLVMINSDRGIFAFEKIKKDIVYKQTNIENSLQPSLIEPYSKPKKREKFWHDLNTKNFDYIVKHYTSNSGILRRIIRRVVRIFNGIY